MSFRTILLFFTAISLLFVFFNGFTTHKDLKKGGLVAFYNVENLFDTLDDPRTNDNDFLPQSPMKWNTERYKNKQARLSQVLKDLDKEGLVLMGLAEVEHKQVVEQWIKSAALPKKYYCIEEESKDPRGIDVALIYNEAFRPLFHKLLRPCKGKECLESRDILAVKGLIQKDTVWVFVNHWPSRRTGVKESEEKRMIVAQVLKQAVDSVLLHSPESRIILLGDFNDTPADQSIVYLLKGGLLFHPLAEKKSTEGSVKYQKEWLLFDQIMLSRNWQSGNGKHITYSSSTAAVYHPLYLHYKNTVTNGPFRTYQGKSYSGGYSDHFPVTFRYND